jgi:hypothetical protein
VGWVRVTVGEGVGVVGGGLERPGPSQGSGLPTAPSAPAEERPAQPARAAGR